MLQAVRNGFGGLEITSKGIMKIKTKLPSHWTALKITGVQIK